MKRYAAQKKPLLTRFQRVRRVKWAKQLLNMTEGIWRQTLFTDECRVELFNKRSFCFRRKGEGHLPQHQRRTVKHPLSVQVWGCFSIRGPGPLVFVDQGASMNGAWYANLLRTVVPDAMEKCSSMFFQDDGAPCHRAKHVQAVKEELNLGQIPWVGQSPDCNPIENLWALLKRRLQLRTCRSRAQLIEAIQDVWTNEIQASTFTILALSMPRRLKAVLKSNGNPTKY